jgi:hypothetical protein
MMCCAMLCCAVLCCAVLRCAVLNLYVAACSNVKCSAVQPSVGAVLQQQSHVLVAFLCKPYTAEFKQLCQLSLFRRHAATTESCTDGDPLVQKKYIAVRPSIVVISI